MKPLDIHKAIKDSTRPKTMGDLATDKVQDILKEAIDFVSEMAKDELEFRSTGHRPDHDALPLQEDDSPPKAFAKAKTCAQLGFEDPEAPFAPTDQ